MVAGKMMFSAFFGFGAPYILWPPAMNPKASDSTGHGHVLRNFFDDWCRDDEENGLSVQRRST
jgi:hypothetical protein